MKNEATNPKFDTVQPPIKNKHIISSGRLSVGDGHELYWVDWGNPKIKEPIFYLHGGPGDGFDEGDFTKFNPTKHRVVFHDQRGSGRSTPFASTSHNTSEHLVKDITKLRVHLGFDAISLYGFSWGSTLALLYAIANPEVVNKMLIGGIFLGREQDINQVLSSRAQAHFPEVFQHLGSSEKLAPQSIREYLAPLLTLQSDLKRQRLIQPLRQLQGSLLRLDHLQGSAEKDPPSLNVAEETAVELHYLLNNSFLEDDFILKNSATIAHIPTVIVQGRYDFICPPLAAYELAEAMGDKAHLHMVLAGHSTREPVIREVIAAYLHSFLHTQ